MKSRQSVSKEILSLFAQNKTKVNIYYSRIFTPAPTTFARVGLVGIEKRSIRSREAPANSRSIWITKYDNELRII